MWLFFTLLAIRLESYMWLWGVLMLSFLKCLKICCSKLFYTNLSLFMQLIKCILYEGQLNGEQILCIHRRIWNAEKWTTLYLYFLPPLIFFPFPRFYFFHHWIMDVSVHWISLHLFSFDQVLVQLLELGSIFLLELLLERTQDLHLPFPSLLLA